MKQTLSVFAVLFFAMSASAGFGGGRIKEDAPVDKFPVGAPVTPPTPQPSGIEGSPMPGWESLGPGGGGTIMFFAISPFDPNTIITTCDMGGVYLTTDGGKNWSIFSNLTRSGWTSFNPQDPKSFLIGNNTAVALTTDGGKTFTFEPRMKEWQSPDCTGFFTLFDPDFPEFAWMSTGGWQEKKGKGGIYHSTNGGRNFNDTKGDSVGTFCWSIAVDPASPKANRRLIAGTEKGLLSSDDGGKTWKRVSSFNARPVWSVAVLSAPDRKKATYFATGGQSFYRSDDRGKTWVDLGLKTGCAAPEIACSPYDDKYVYATDTKGIYVSSDGGQTFKLTGTSVREKGWWETHPESMRWANNATSHGGHVGGIAVSPSHPQVAVCGSSGSAHITRDGGENWDAMYTASSNNYKSFSGHGMEVTTCYGAVFSPGDPNTVFGMYTDMGMFRSDDGGVSWNRSMDGAPRSVNDTNCWNTVYQIAFDPADSKKIWMVHTAKHDLPYKYQPKDKYYLGYVSKSTNGGINWSKTSEGCSDTALTSIIVNPDSPASKRQLFVCAFSDGVYRSDDDGAKWTKKSKGLPSNAHVWRLTIGPKIPKVANRTLYVTVIRPPAPGIYRSDDLGENWTKMSGNFDAPYDLVVDEKNPDRLYLSNDSGSNGGFHLSTDAGKTWKQVVASSRACGINISPFDDNAVFFCGGSAWYSVDRGETFAKIDTFMKGNATRATIDPRDPNALWIGTFGQGYFRGAWKPGTTVQLLMLKDGTAAAFGFAAATTRPAVEAKPFGASGIAPPKADAARADSLRTQIIQDIVSAIKAADLSALKLDAPIYGRIKTVGLGEADEDFMSFIVDGAPLEMEWSELSLDTFKTLALVVLQNGSPDVYKRLAEYLAAAGDPAGFRQVYSMTATLSPEHRAAVASLLPTAPKPEGEEGDTEKPKDAQ